MKFKNIISYTGIIALFIIQHCSIANAQLPTCGMIYGISASQIYNYDPALAISTTNPSVNTIPLSSGSSWLTPGLTVSPVLGSSSNALTFYTIVNNSGTFQYAYYSSATSGWVNTGHSTGTNNAINIAAGGGYIYSLNGFTGDVYRYDGTSNAAHLVTVSNFPGEGPYDLVADCDGNWYVLNQTGNLSTPFLRKYSPSGTLLQSWTLSNPNNLIVSASAGFGIAGNKLYTDNAYNNGITYYTLGVSTLTMDSTKPFPANYGWRDIGTCAASVPSTPMVTIAASGSNGCVGATFTFTATPVSGGIAPVYQWKVNGSNTGTGGASFSYVPANGDVVSCVMTSNSVCATSTTAVSNAITITSVNMPVTPALGIIASANGVCSGMQIAFTATPSNGGSTPTYQWKVNGASVGTSSSNYNYVPANGDIVTCILNSSESCVTASTAISNAVTMVVNATTTPAINISAPSTNSCSGSTVAFVATPVSGGPTPVFQWKVNGINVGTNNPNYSYVPGNGDVVTCALTSNASCVTTSSAASNALTMSVINAVTPAINIAASANGVCTGTPVTFTATPGNGGTAPVYQWKVNNSIMGSNNATFSYSPLNGDTVACVLTSNETCVSPATAASNQVAMLVGPLVIPGINVNSIPPIVGCEGTTILFVTNIVAGGAIPGYQWYKNGTAVPGATSHTYTDSLLKNGDTIRATLISSAACPSTPITWSNHVGLSLSPPVVPTISVSPAGPVSAGVLLTFTAAVTDTGMRPTYQWKKNGVSIPFANGLTYTTSGLSAGDVITATLISGDPCAVPALVLSNSVQVAWSAAGIAEANNEWFTLLYPNPNKGNFRVSVSQRNLMGSNRYAIDVINTLGQALYHCEVASQVGKLDHVVVLQDDLPAGKYFLRVHDDHGISVTTPFLILR